MSSTIPPKLKRPGAGLPWWELLIARHLIFPRFCNQTWAAAAQRFQEEGARVLAVFDSLPPDRLQQRVLVRRAAGMEDSSRFWSAAMTVEHLSMVGTAILQTIDILRRGELPTREPRIEDFKPQGVLAPGEARSEFVDLLTNAARCLPSVPRGAGPRYAHPWFGPIDAHQWHCLLAFHQGIHRKQIEAIAKVLGGTT